MLVPGDIKLGMLHSAIQVALGWTNSHLHHFVVGKTLIGMADVDSYAPTIDENKVRLDEIAKAKTRFTYKYDFGDSWKHEVVVEKILPGEPGTTYPRCVAGERACPPEDCGGVGGYEHLLEVIADHKHEEHDELMDWLGGSFDPEAFDLEAVNGARRSSRRRTSQPRAQGSRTWLHVSGA